MMNMQPYIYKLTFKPQNLVYIGSSTKVGCNPNQFWTSYFTSSKVIEQLISLFGTSSDVWEYTIVHQPEQYDDIKDIVRLENLMIFELLNSTDKHLAINEHCYKTDGGVFTAAGATRSVETRAKMSAAKLGVKREVFNTFDKTVYTFKNKFTLVEFIGTRRALCQTHEITSQEAYHIVSGKLKHSKGWGMFLVDKDCYSYETPYQSRTVTKTACPHCNAQATPGNFKRWHGDNCKLNPSYAAA